jgi:hypothetical protein
VTQATGARAPAHARILQKWLDLPTWRALSLAARVLLVEMLAEHRPDKNGFLAWPVRRAAERLGVSKDTAARALIELERNGWLNVSTPAAFGGRAKAATYAVTMFPDSRAGAPASFAFEHLPGEPARLERKRKRVSVSHGKDKAVPPVRRNGRKGRTKQSHGKDKPAPAEALAEERDERQISMF